MEQEKNITFNDIIETDLIYDECGTKYFVTEIDETTKTVFLVNHWGTSFDLSVDSFNEENFIKIERNGDE